MNLNFIGAINQLSYGLCTINLVTELQKLGVDVALFPINHGPYDIPNKYVKPIMQAADLAHFYSLKAPCVRLWHQFSLAEFVGKGTHIGFPIFELNRFTTTELHHLRCCDELIVCSKWAKNIIEENGIYVDTHVVPLGVDTKIFSPKKGDGEKTIFLNIGKWEKRKGHEILADIFLKAFPTENVELWMVCDSPLYTQEEVLQWKMKYRQVLGDRVRFFPLQKNQEDIANIMRQSDCGIFPTLAEGFGLPILEMMACSKPVIVTNYSGPTEFCNDKNSHLVSIDKLEGAYDEKWFRNGIGQWAYLGEEQIEKIIHFLRKIHLDKQAGHDIINYSGIETGEYFSWKHSAEKLIEVL